MPPPDLVLTFLLATMAWSLVPGPGLAYMAVQTMMHGRRAGWASLVAFHLGSYVHIGLAAFGVTALLEAAPDLILVLKLAGAAYLVWMGLRILRSSPAGAPPPEIAPDAAPRRAFRDTLVLELLSPESALFFFLFLPQFVSVQGDWPVWAQILVLGALANLIFSTGDALWVLASDALAGAGRLTGRARIWGRRIGAAVLIVLGLRLAATAP